MNVDFAEEIKMLIEEHKKVYAALKELEKEGIAEYKEGVWYYKGREAEIEQTNRSQKEIL